MVPVKDFGINQSRIYQKRLRIFSIYGGVGGLVKTKYVSRIIKTLLERRDLRLLVIFVCLLSPPCGCTHFNGRPYHNQEDIPVLFKYVDPQAGKVCISGSFNQWSAQSHCLEKDGQTWSIEIPLAPGRYTYLFVVDDTYPKSDPGALLTEESGFGTNNSVLTVE